MTDAQKINEQFNQTKQQMKRILKYYQNFIEIKEKLHPDIHYLAR